jgi:hypothetical protein
MQYWVSKLNGVLQCYLCGKVMVSPSVWDWIGKVASFDGIYETVSSQDWTKGCLLKQNNKENFLPISCKKKMGNFSHFKLY